MKKYLLLTLVGCCLFPPSLFSQARPTADKPSVAPTPPPIPEEARKHFVKGNNVFQGSKTADDFVRVQSEFKQAVDLAPRWPEPRYNLALAKEAAGDYSGAMADLKLYQQFKLSETEARTVQDKIYALKPSRKKRQETSRRRERCAQQMAKNAADEKARADTKLAAVYQGLDGGVWMYKQTNYYLLRNHTRQALEVDGHEIVSSWSDDLNPRRESWRTTFTSRHFQVTVPPSCSGSPSCTSALINITISDDGQTITVMAADGSHGPLIYPRAN